MLFCCRGGLREGRPAAEAGGLRPTVCSRCDFSPGDSRHATSRPSPDPRGSRLAVAASLNSYSDHQLPLTVP